MAPDILKTIEAANAERIARQLSVHPLEYLKELCSNPESGRGYLAEQGFSPAPRPPRCFEDALRRPGLSFICEVKKASPSKGVIDAGFPYLDIARSYERAGADCISCLTEPQWFMGSDAIFMDIRQQVGTPMIRKDFTVGDGYGDYGLTLGEYQIYQAKLMGADAVLLIAALLDTASIEHFLAIAADLGLSALVEAHTAKEISSAVDAGATVIGVNNRNLHDFTVDFENARRLRDCIPDTCLYVAESGISSIADVETIAEIGADAVLVGEMLMRSENREATLAQMRKAGAR
ncbi:MAG: indole-3-glycerol phosphate synthase TrpC [Eggerthellaceae bacterium]|jgi:indole-3-glycerol phosphate synthase